MGGALCSWVVQVLAAIFSHCNAVCEGTSQCRTWRTLLWVLQSLSVKEACGRSHLLPYLKDPRSDEAWKAGASVDAGQSSKHGKLLSEVFCVFRVGGWVVSVWALTSLHDCTRPCTSLAPYTCGCDGWNCTGVQIQISPAFKAVSFFYLRISSRAPERTPDEKPFCIKSDNKLFFLNINLYFPKMFQPTYIQHNCNQINFCLNLSSRRLSINNLQDDVLSEW